MEKTLQELQSEIRYGQRLAERTARLYRHAQSLGTFGTVLGGSGMLAAVAAQIPAWVPLAGGLLFAIMGAALVAIRPADKAAQNEADVKRYAALLTRSLAMTPSQVETALAEARQSDAAEIEALRDVAWNDVDDELGRAEVKVPLPLHARIIAAVS